MSHVTVTAHLNNVGRLPGGAVMMTERIVEERRRVILETMVLAGTVTGVVEMVETEGVDPLRIHEHGATPNTVLHQTREITVPFTTVWTEPRTDTLLGRNLSHVQSIQG
jgi:hypothetical protein